MAFLHLKTVNQNAFLEAELLDLTVIQQVFFFFIWVLRTVKTISLILSQVSHKVGQKQEIPEKNHLTTCKQNLTSLASDPS